MPVGRCILRDFITNLLLFQVLGFALILLGEFKILILGEQCLLKTWIRLEMELCQLHVSGWLLLVVEKQQQQICLWFKKNAFIAVLKPFYLFTGVSCDACLKGNFRGRRYKCLICYDYDLCATCYESGATTTRHTTDHPMQCILTRVDFGKW